MGRGAGAVNAEQPSYVAVWLPDVGPDGVIWSGGRGASRATSTPPDTSSTPTCG
jgi:hypothetical protein